MSHDERAASESTQAVDSMPGSESTLSNEMAQASVKASESTQPTVHAHVHQHADGVVHSHYHSHAGGNVAHEHLRGESQPDVVEFDSAQEAHSEDAIPIHAHDDVRVVDAPLKAHGLSYAYPHAAADVFSGLSIEAHAGSVLAILGNNGAGKSTLLDLLAGITKPRSGSVTVGGEDLSGFSRRQIAQKIAYVAQQQTIPHLSVYDEVLLGRKPHIVWKIGDADREIVAKAIESLQLESFSGRFCDELSGGERQKVFIARALAQEPQILILDEPTSALDPKNQLEVLSAIREVTREERLATILVLHDINLALRFCDRFVLVRDGRIVSQGDHDAVNGETLSETYDTQFKIVSVDGIRMAVPAMA